MQYHRARWYDPAIGRFTALDPFSGVPSRPATLHKYAYAGDDPVNQVDPSGEFALAGGMATGVLSTIAMQTTVAIGGSVLSRAVLLRLALYMAASVASTYVIADAVTKSKIKECIDSSKGGKSECKPDYPIFILGDNYAQVRDHVGDALGNGYPSMLSAKSSPYPRGWLDKHKKSGKECDGGAGTDCDEYPWAASMEGGEKNSPSLRSVDRYQNRGAGSTIRWFYQNCKIKKDDAGQKYKVIAIKGLSESGYICRM